MVYTEVKMVCIIVESIYDPGRDIRNAYIIVLLLRILLTESSRNFFVFVITMNWRIHMHIWNRHGATEEAQLLHIVKGKEVGRGARSHSVYSFSALLRKVFDVEVIWTVRTARSKALCIYSSIYEFQPYLCFHKSIYGVKLIMVTTHRLISCQQHQIETLYCKWSTEICCWNTAPFSVMTVTWAHK